MNKKKDRFLFRKNDHTLSEYSLYKGNPTFVKHHSDAKLLINDFCYYDSPDRDESKNQIMILSKRGILKRINCATDAARKFEISDGNLKMT